MSALAALSAAIAIIGWCLVHFVWQAACVGALYAAARLLLPRGNARYVAAMLALLVIAACPIATAWHEWAALPTPAAPGGIVATPAAAAMPAAAAAGPLWSSIVAMSLPWLVLVWAAGVGVLGTRVFRQWLGLRALLREACNVPEWQACARRLGDRFGLRRAIPVLASLRVAVPTVIGWMKPVVVLPVAVVARMPAAQIELVLAHEMAHLKRFDHLANLLQLVLETLFFYHPVVHWISRDARNERELCCDALALRATGGERRDFVAALVSLAEFRTAHAGLALAANGGVLAERAGFIAGALPPAPRARTHLATLLVVLALVAGAGVLWHQDIVRQRVENALSANAAIVREGLASIRPADSPRYQRVPMRRPELAPLRLVAAAPEPPHGAVAPPAFPRLPRIAPDLQPPGAPAMPALTLRMPLPNVPVGRGLVSPAPPHAIRTVRPAYPPEALAEGLQGQVEIAFTLSAAGIPENLEVVRSAFGALDAAALEALSRWRFSTPSQTTRSYRQTFTFRLGAENDDATTGSGCLILTGSHICRHAFGPDAAVETLQAGH